MPDRIGENKEEADKIVSIDKYIMKSRKSEYHTTDQKVINNGISEWYDSSRIPLINFDGEVVGILCTCEIITDRIITHKKFAIFSSSFPRPAQGSLQPVQGSPRKVHPSLSSQKTHNS